MILYETIFIMLHKIRNKNEVVLARIYILMLMLQLH